MLDRTRALWRQQDRHEGNRWRLFRAVSDHVRADRVLYPGSYVDVAPSFVFPSVTYVDVDDRAAAFFADRQGVAELIREHPGSPAEPRFEFHHADYTADLGLPAGGFDLLVSLYAGFVSEACTGLLRVGGTLLVNPSHGDAALASLDRRYRLGGAVLAHSGGYRVSTADLDTFLQPKKPAALTRESLRAWGRGVAYTRPAFAYLFRRVR